MANVPTVGVFVPNGYLNIGSWAGPTGQQDAYGQNFPTGLNPGKVIELGPNGALAVSAPGTTLYDGAYQSVKLDSGATASLATQGLAAFIRIDSGATQGTSLMTDYNIPVVTTADRAADLGGAATPFAGVFLNPATYNGQSNEPTPGEWIFIFVGAGRAVLQANAAVVDTDQLLPAAPSAGTGEFSPAAPAASLYPPAFPVQLIGAAGPVVAYYRDLIYRIPNL
jgi:hypothetical protein